MRSSRARSDGNVCIVTTLRFRVVCQLKIIISVFILTPHLNSSGTEDDWFGITKAATIP